MCVSLHACRVRLPRATPWPATAAHPPPPPTHAFFPPHCAPSHTHTHTHTTQIFTSGRLDVYVLVPMLWALYNAIPPLLFFVYFFTKGRVLQGLCSVMQVLGVLLAAGEGVARVRDRTVHSGAVPGRGGGGGGRGAGGQGMRVWCVSAGVCVWGGGQRQRLSVVLGL
jgi:hypothetical protein